MALFNNLCDIEEARFWHVTEDAMLVIQSATHSTIGAMCFLIKDAHLPLFPISDNDPVQGRASCIFLSPPGKCLESLSIREIWPTWQMGRNNTSAWPEVENEVGCHHAEQGWGRQKPTGRMLCMSPRLGSGRARRVRRPEPGAGNAK